jgi:hypothetical protein
VQQLTPILKRATSAIPAEYFQLAIHGGQPVYRERVYCYELYHQMRRIWPHACPYWLNGEIDKQGHRLLAQRGAARFKPDFLVHTPGDMAGNYAIMEVKPLGANSDDIHNDLYKLSLFISGVEYRRAIYLFYGYGEDGGTMDRVRQAYARLDDPRTIEIWLHAAPGQPARCLLELPPQHRT